MVISYSLVSIPYLEPLIPDVGGKKMRKVDSRKLFWEVKSRRKIWFCCLHVEEQISCEILARTMMKSNLSM